jgi:hypothetical protein
MFRTFRLAGIHLALAAMMLRALMPDGWMPNTAAAGGMPIALCTIDGPVSLVVAETGKPAPHDPAHNDGRHVDVCPFAASPHFATVTPAVVPTLPLAEAFFAPRLPQSIVFAAGGRHTPQSPRAPPSFV